MGCVYSLPDTATDVVKAAAAVTTQTWSHGLELSSTAAAKAARKATLTKYALVKCTFDADASAKAKRLEAIKEMLYDQIALWNAWKSATVAMDFSVLAHWSRHCHANGECTARLKKVAMSVQNASAAHKEYVGFMHGPFIDALDEAIDKLDDAWNMYEKYEKAEYKLKLAEKTSKKEEQKIAILKGEAEIALQDAKKSLDDTARDVEQKILVPWYDKANQALQDFVKKCASVKEVGAVNKNEADEFAAAAFDRANSVAYTKIKKRTMTAGDAASAAMQLVGGGNTSHLPEKYNEINAQLAEMRRHGAALVLTLREFIPYIRIIFGPDRMNSFADNLCKKIDGFKALKKTVVNFNDKIAALTNDIDVDEYKTITDELDQIITMEFGRVAQLATDYTVAIAQITHAENALVHAEKVHASNAEKFIMPPIGKEKLKKFNAAKDAWNKALEDAKNNIIISRERAESTLNNHEEAFAALFLVSGCTFNDFIIVKIENACRSITDANSIVSAVKPRAIKDAAEEPDEEEVIEVQQIESLEVAEESLKEAAEAQAQAEKAKADKEEAEKKAAAAAEAAEKAAAAAEDEANEEKKRQKLKKAAQEAEKAEAERKAKEEAEAKEAAAAKAALEKEKAAEEASEKAKAELEEQVAMAEKVAELEASNAEHQHKTIQLTRQASLANNTVSVQSHLERRASTIAE